MLTEARSYAGCCTALQGSPGSIETNFKLSITNNDTVQAACCSDDWRSFRAEAPRSMPLAGIDPSLALGFYCSSLGEASVLLLSCYVHPVVIDSWSVEMCCRLLL